MTAPPRRDRRSPRATTALYAALAAAAVAAVVLAVVAWRLFAPVPPPAGLVDANPPSAAAAAGGYTPGADAAFTGIALANTGDTPYRVVAVAPEGATAGDVTVADVMVLTGLPSGWPPAQLGWPPTTPPGAELVPVEDFTVAPGATATLAVRVSTAVPGRVVVPSWRVTVDVGGREVDVSLPWEFSFTPPINIDDLPAAADPIREQLGLPPAG
jgi:hypothetical protein